MAEKRRPTLTMLLRFPGKKKATKLEIYPAELWGWKKTDDKGVKVGKKYRLRLNGKWFNSKRDDKFFWRSEIRDLLWFSLRGKF